MTLTTIQQDAIAKARRGDFSLLDAMELKHRIDEDQAAHGYLVGGRLRLIAYGCPQDNPCLACTGEGKHECHAAGCDDGDIECDQCKGTEDHTTPHAACGGEGCDEPGCVAGQVDCDKCGQTGLLTCPECRGDGVVECGNCEGEGDFPPDVWEDLRVENLDGRVVWREDDPDEPDHPTGWEGQVDRTWAETILAAYQKELRAAAKSAAVPADDTAGQTTIALEPA